MATAGTASIEAKIKAQETKLKQLKAQKQQIEARQRTAAAKISRQQDTRRKVLVGAVILAKVGGSGPRTSCWRCWIPP